MSDHRQNAMEHFLIRFKKRLKHRISKAWVKEVTELIESDRTTHHLKKIPHSDDWYFVDYKNVRVWVLYNPALTCLVTCLHPSVFPNCGNTHKDRELFSRYLQAKASFYAENCAPMKFYKRKVTGACRTSL